MQFKPIGHIESGFKFKNGTPRQPTVCGAARARLTINTDTYSNPEHSLEGLQQFSHVWVIFVFHKNNNPYIKPKVNPPRLNGARVGVFSTRSPYRLNPIGLTLARVERIEGATVHLSGVDMLDGTPVLDLKPYIPLYDQPQPRGSPHLDLVCQSDLPGEAAAAAIDQLGMGCVDLEQSVQAEEASASFSKSGEVSVCEGEISMVDSDANSVTGVNTLDYGSALLQTSQITKNKPGSKERHTGQRCKHGGKGQRQVETEAQSDIDDLDQSIPIEGQTGGRQTHIEDGGVQIGTCPHEGGQVDFADWIKSPPFHKLSVRWTPTAEAQLQRFSKEAVDDRYRLEFVKSREAARTAVGDILQGDPRSAYRRNKCADRLYFFMLDVLHVTCWFNDDEDVAEVVRIKPNREKMLQKLAGNH